MALPSFREAVVEAFYRLAPDFENGRDGTRELITAVSEELECGELEVLGAIGEHLALEKRAKLN